MSMTWAEFKAKVEALGVEDDTPLAWIDVTYPSPTDILHISRNAQGAVEIGE